MSQNQVRNLQEKLACQDEEICYLKEKLRTYNEDMAAKDALQKQFVELQQLVEEAEINYKRTNDEQLNIIKCQGEKLEKSKLAVTSLRADNLRLKDVNDCQAEQLKTLQRKEEKLITDIETLEISNKNLKNDLCHVKNQLHEECCTVEKLTEQLKCKQEELKCRQKKLEECQAAVGQLTDLCKKFETDVASIKAKLVECQATECRLRERCRDREADLECARAKLEDNKSCAAATEARLQAEAAAMARELECRAQKLRETEAERDGWKRRAAEEKCRADRSDATVAELRAADERERTEVEAREQRLKRHLCEKDEKLRCCDERLTAARLGNECAAAAVATLETRVRTAEDQLEDCKRSAEVQEREQDEARQQLEREKATLSCELRRKTDNVAELERQACRLRDEIRRAGDDRSRCPTCSSLPPPPPQETVARDRASCGVTTNDSFVCRLRRLCRDLQEPLASYKT